MGRGRKLDPGYLVVVDEATVFQVAGRLDVLVKDEDAWSHHSVLLDPMNHGRLDALGIAGHQLGKNLVIHVVVVADEDESGVGILPKDPLDVGDLLPAGQVGFPADAALDGAVR